MGPRECKCRMGLRECKCRMGLRECKCGMGQRECKCGMGQRECKCRMGLRECKCRIGPARTCAARPDPVGAQSDAAQHAARVEERRGDGGGAGVVQPAAARVEVLELPHLA